MVGEILVDDEVVMQMRCWRVIISERSYTFDDAQSRIPHDLIYYQTTKLIEQCE
jgi:hypothetical protein